MLVGNSRWAHWNFSTLLVHSQDSEDWRVLTTTSDVGNVPQGPRGGGGGSSGELSEGVSGTLGTLFNTATYQEPLECESGPDMPLASARVTGSQ